MTPKRQPLQSEYYKINTQVGTLHVHIDFDETGPKRVFSQVPPVGSDTANTTALIGLLLSKYLKAGGSANGIVKHLFSVRGNRIGVWEGTPIESIPQAIGIALQAHLNKHATVPTGSLVSSIAGPIAADVPA
jgi:hypothetical protein